MTADHSTNIDEATYTDEDRIAPYPQEALLVDVVAEMSAERILCTSPGLAQFAGARRSELPIAVVTCTYLDAYRAGLASATLARCPAQFADSMHRSARRPGR